MVAVGLALVGCSGKKSENAVDLQGAGATFPELIYKAWFAEYQKKNPDVTINYQPLGSGRGIAQFTAGTVFFGASDVPMNKDELEKAKNNVVQLPMTAGKVVVAFNLKDADGNEVKSLKLSRKAMVAIFSGKIEKWNDAAIADENKDVKLPDKTVRVVVRADSSGTSFVFSNHLATIDKGFADTIKGSKSPNWPSASNFTKQPGNAKVTSQVKQTDGSVAYIEYGFAKENNLGMASIENKSGKYVVPTIESGQATLAAGKLPEDMTLIFSDPEGEGSYPITSYTWILAKKTYEEGDRKKVDAFKSMLKWCLKDGQKMSADKGYIPLPDGVTEQVVKAVDSIKP